MKIETPEKASNFDPDKAQEAFGELVDVFQRHRLTVAEILIVLGNLSYTLGASMEGFKEKGPSMEELQKMYYLSPTPGIALMINGVTVCLYFSDLNKIQSNNQ